MTQRNKNRFASFYLIALVISLTLLSPGCTPSGQLPQQICDIGSVVCEVSQNLCSTLPVPEAVCTYVNLACLNLTVLCQEPAGTEKYVEALNDLGEANELLQEWVQKQNTQPDSLQ